MVFVIRSFVPLQRGRGFCAFISLPPPLPCKNSTISTNPSSASLPCLLRRQRSTGRGHRSQCKDQLRLPSPAKINGEKHLHPPPSHCSHVEGEKEDSVSRSGKRHRKGGENMKAKKKTHSFSPGLKLHVLQSQYRKTKELLVFFKMENPLEDFGKGSEHN